MFLTHEQLVDLTGLSQGAAQIRWLKAHGITHWVRVDGKPRVPMAAVEGRSSASPAELTQPDFGALRAAQ